MSRDRTKVYILLTDHASTDDDVMFERSWETGFKTLCSNIKIISRIILSQAFWKLFYSVVSLVNPTEVMAVADTIGLGRQSDTLRRRQGINPIRSRQAMLINKSMQNCSNV